MALIIVGGQSRAVGKTSVVVGLIAALPAYHWSAVKITQFGHPGHPSRSDPSEKTADTEWTITEEHDHFGTSDTSRYLAAGAKSAFLIETADGRLHEAMPAIQSKLAEAQNAIIESNSILEFIRPDIYIMVLDPSTEDFKASAQTYLDRADAFVIHQGRTLHRQSASPEETAARPVFRIIPPQYVNRDLVKFVAMRLETKPHSPA